ncbi:MAG: hypothetical protein ACYCUM_07110 [Solirubrobacteraceae bacterium]
MASHDEYRIRVQTPAARGLLDALRCASVEPHERALLGRVATTREGDHVFLYADSRDLADVLAATVARTLGERALEGEVTLWRWHPLEERWEDAELPLPSTEQEQRGERERLAASEDAESRARGYDEWEVRVSLPSHEQARALAERLAAEGVRAHRSWRHLIVGVEDEAAGRELASRIEAEERGAEALVEGAGMPLWKSLNPYAVFGGLGL